MKAACTVFNAFQLRKKWPSAYFYGDSSSITKIRKNRITIRPDEIEVQFCRSSGPGGQFVNKRESAVRITHKPTGLSVFLKPNAISFKIGKMRWLYWSIVCKKKTTRRRSRFGRCAFGTNW